MIIFEDNIIESLPYRKFKEFYEEAISLNQENIEAACISTISEDFQSHSRFINIKYINKNGLIFFTNYNSKKGTDIEFNNKVSLAFFWSSSKTQIRIEGSIKKIDSIDSDKHWNIRSAEKKALAISSMQSQPIDSYKNVKDNFAETLKSTDLTKRPNYWGGYIVMPTFFEYWKGNVDRINERKALTFKNQEWTEHVLQP